jgi:hypothetical protein
MAKTRRAYTGGAVSTTTTLSIAASGTTSFTITAGTGWPYGSDPFYIVVEPGTASEEKILVTRTGVGDTTLNIASDSVRGLDGTAAVSHGSGVTVFPVFTAVDADEANELASKWTTKGDLVSYGSSTFEKLGVGADDTVLIADSGEASGLKWGAVDTEQLAAGAVTAAKVDALVPLGARNLVYNGAMQVAQRGTSATGITSGDYRTADRWSTDLFTLGTWTESIENDAPTGSGFRKSLKLTCTTADAAPAAGDIFNLRHALEGQDVQVVKKGTSSAEQLTASFWVKSNVTGTYTMILFDFDNTRQVAASYSISSSGTWEKKTITFPADTTGAFDNDNGPSLGVFFCLGAGSDFTSGTLQATWASYTAANRAVGQTNLAAATNNYWQVTGVQLEIGDTATPFEHKPYGEELSRCYRYYWEQAGGNSVPFGVGAMYSSTQVYTNVTFPREMRTAPTLVTTTGSGYYRFSRTGAGASLDFVAADVVASRSAWLYNDATSATSGVAGIFRTNNASALIAWSAEL